MHTPETCVSLGCHDGPVVASHTCLCDTCAHCGEPIAERDIATTESVAAEHLRELRARAWDEGRCPICAVGLTHTASWCANDPPHNPYRDVVTPPGMPNGGAGS